MAFVRVATVAEVPPGSFLAVEVEDEPIALFNVEGRIYATRDECTHDGGELTGGQLQGHVITCPRHGARFDVTTGEALTLPAFEPLETLEVKVKGDAIYVDLDLD